MQDKYEKASGQVRELSNMDPDQLADHMSKNMDTVNEVAPNLATHMNMTMAKGLSFLQSKLPRPTIEFNGDPKWEPNNTQKDQFMQHHEIVNNPLKILHHVKEGTLTNSHLEALNSVYPALYAEMRDRVKEQMTPKNMEKMSYNKKMALSKFLQEPHNQSFMPAILAHDQGIYAQQNAPQQAQAQPKKRKSGSTQGGLAKLSLSKRSATETERDEE